MTEFVNNIMMVFYNQDVFDGVKDDRDEYDRGTISIHSRTYIHNMESNGMNICSEQTESSKYFDNKIGFGYVYGYRKYGWLVNDYKINNAIIKRLNACNGLCPCQNTSKDKHCPCSNYRYNDYCCCGLYIKDERYGR